MRVADRQAANVVVARRAAPCLGERQEKALIPAQAIDHRRGIVVQRRVIGIQRDREPGEIGDILAHRQLRIDVQPRNRLKVRKLRAQYRRSCLERPGVRIAPPIAQRTAGIKRASLIVEAMSQLVADHRADGAEIDRSHGPIYGLAMDLGTTTVVLRLLNLETGEVVADASFENPQRFGGSDVMSRIQYDTEDGAKLLQRTLAGYITHAIEEFPVDPKSIYEMVVAANSTMRDLFFRLNVYSIGQNPYQSITELEMAEGRRTTTSLSATAGRLGLPIHPKARVYGLPIISGHVGADAAACLLAVDMANEERIVALMDIGTNTELILGNRLRQILEKARKQASA